MKISACMIAKNEEKCIARCIESYKEIVDELIVVDTGSSDRTVEIAKKFGAKLYHFCWNDDFAEARNFAINQAKGDWIIFLDADEYFSNQTGLNIPNILQSIHANHKIQGIYCKFYHVNEDEGFKIKSSDYLLRIFRNNEKIRYEGQIHEEVKYDGQPVYGASAPEEAITIYHTGYSSKLVNLKLERNLKLLLDKFKDESSRDAIAYFYLSDCYFGLGDYELAIKHARLSIEKGLHTYGHNIKPHLNLINSLIFTKRPFSEIINEINLAIKKFPAHPDLFRLLGATYFSRGKFIDSSRIYAKALQLYTDYNGKEVFSDKACIRDIYFQLGIIYSYKNDYSLALDYFIKALREHKLDSVVFKFLLQIIRNERPEDVIFLLKKIYDENNKEDVEFLVKNLSKFKMGIVLMFFHNVWLKKYGQEDITVMFMLLSIGKYDESFKHFFEAMQIEGGEWADIFALTSAILSDRKENVLNVLGFMRAPLRKITEAFLGFDNNISLTEEDVEDYLNLMNEFLLLNKYPQLVKIISLKVRFNFSISGAIGDLLFKNMAYSQALEQYCDASNEENDNPDIYFKLGLAYYKNLDYPNAVHIFKKALAQGYKKPDIYDYLYWISEQCTDQETKREAAIASINPESDQQQVNI